MVSLSGWEGDHMQQCPACKHELTMAEQLGSSGKCPACGIYFAKYRARAEREAAAAKAQADKKQASESPKKIVMTPAQFYGGTLYCTNCGTVSNGVRQVPGSILIELLLWICFFIPGLIYSIWRHAAQRKACPACKLSGLIPVMSPKAQKELAP